MKNKLLSLIIATTILSAPVANAASPFNGYGVGAGIGWTNNRIKGETKNTTPLLSQKVTKNLFPVGIFVNYMYSSPNSFLWALEAGLDYDFGSDASFKNNGTEYAKAKKRFSAMLTPKFGYNSQDNLAFYALVGLGGTSWKYTLTNIKSSTKFQLAIAPGAGFEVDLGNNVKAGAEYKYVIYKSYDINFNGAKATFSPESHDVRVRLSFNFGQ